MSGDRTTTQTTTNTPYPAMVPLYDKAAQDALAWYNAGGSRPNTMSTVVPYSQQTMQGLNAIQQNSQNALNQNAMGGALTSFMNSYGQDGFNAQQRQAMSGMGQFAQGNGGNVNTDWIRQLGGMATGQAPPSGPNQPPPNPWQPPPDGHNPPKPPPGNPPPDGPPGFPDPPPTYKPNPKLPPHLSGPSGGYGNMMGNQHFGPVPLGNSDPIGGGGAHTGGGQISGQAVQPTGPGMSGWSMGGGSSGGGFDSSAVMPQNNQISGQAVQPQGGGANSNGGNQFFGQVPIANSDPIKQGGGAHTGGGGISGQAVQPTGPGVGGGSFGGGMPDSSAVMPRPQSMPGTGPQLSSMPGAFGPGSGGPQTSSMPGAPPMMPQSMPGADPLKPQPPGQPPPDSNWFPKPDRPPGQPPPGPAGNPAMAGYGNFAMGGGNISSSLQEMMARVGGNNPALSGFANLSQGQGPSVSEQNLMKVAQGGMLNGGDPYFENVLKRATDDTTNAVNSQAAAMGRTGSGTNQAVVAREVGDLQNAARSSQYNQERQNQVSAAGLIDQQRGQNFNNQLGALAGYGGLAGQGFDRELNAANSASQIQSSNADRQLNAIGGLGGTYATGIGQGLQAAGMQANVDAGNKDRQLQALMQQFGQGQTGMQNLANSGSVYQNMLQGQNTPAQNLMGVGSYHEDLYGRQLNDRLRIANESMNQPLSNIQALLAMAGGAGQYGNSYQTAQGPNNRASQYGGMGLGLLSLLRGF